MVVSTDGAFPGPQTGKVDEEASRVVDTALGGGLEGVLAPYPSQHHQGVWAALTSYITPALLSQIIPPFIPGEPGLRPTPPTLPPSPPTKSPPPPPSPPGKALHFTPILGGGGPGTLPAQRTSHAMDTSPSLHALVGAAKGGWRGVLGELQAAFIWCLLGQSYEGIVAWKALLDTILRAEDALMGEAGSEKEKEEEEKKGRVSSRSGGAAPICDEFWVEALGSVVPAQISALGEGVEGVEDRGSVVAQGLSSLVVSGERWLKEGRGGRGRVQRAIGVLLECSVGRERGGEGEGGGFWKPQDATLGGAFSLAHVKALVKRLLEKGGEAREGAASDSGSGSGGGGSTAGQKGGQGFSSLSELLRDLEIQGGDGDLPTFVE